MPAGKAAALKGIFGHMLDRVLKVAKKSGRELDPEMLIKGHGKNVAKADHIAVFKVGSRRTLRGKTKEYVRQLRLQMDGINGMTANELLEKVSRTGTAQKDARERYKKYLTKEIRKEHRQQGLSGRALEQKVEDEVRKEMSGLVALHNPDIVAGGKDIIKDGPDGLPLMGDKWVNSSIGSQWKHKGLADALKDYARQLQAAGKGDQLLNVDFILE